MGQLFDIGFETFTAEEWQVIDAIIKTFEFYGCPDDPFSEAGQKVIESVINVWEVLRPYEAVEWKRERDLYQGAELDIHDQVKQQTGRTLASYPRFIHQVIKKLFPELKWKREDHMRFARMWPLFRFANKI